MVFATRALLGDGNQLRDLYNYLNHKVITAINNLDGSTLGNNLIISQQVLILNEVAENEQERIAPRASCSIKVGSTRH